MIWPPTKIDMLHNLDGASEFFIADARGFVAGPGKGVACYDPFLVKPLIDDGLARELEGMAMNNAFCLTDKGKEAVAMLDGRSGSSKYRQPDWLLSALTK